MSTSIKIDVSLSPAFRDRLQHRSQGLNLPCLELPSNERSDHCGYNVVRHQLIILSSSARLTRSVPIASFHSKIQCLTCLAAVGLVILTFNHVSAGCCSSADCANGQTCVGAPSSCSNPDADSNVGSCGTITTSSCFSKNSIVDVLGKGPTAMQSLKVGDKVLTSDASYETVYAFGHWDETTKAEFLEIEAQKVASVQETEKTTLQVTKDHLLSVNGRFIPANAVQVGDVIATERSELSATVKKIRFVKETGLYAPLTQSGTLVVDGLVASCYVSLQSILPEHLELDGKPVMSQHSFSHLALSPIRLRLGISPNLCENGLALDKQTSYAWFTKLGFVMVDSMEQSHESPLLQSLLLAGFVAFFGTFRALELALGGACLAPTVLFLVGAVLYRIIPRCKLEKIGAE